MSKKKDGTKSDKEKLQAQAEAATKARELLLRVKGILRFAVDASYDDPRAIAVFVAQGLHQNCLIDLREACDQNFYANLSSGFIFGVEEMLQVLGDMSTKRLKRVGINDPWAVLDVCAKVLEDHLKDMPLSHSGA